MFPINPRLLGFDCLRCGTPHPIDDYPTGCPPCLAAGFPASVKPRYAPASPTTATARARGMGRFAHLLPYLTFPSLGEGDTLLVELSRLARALGLSALAMKCEFQQPTGSHKDRMSCLAVARAAAVGAQTVIAASSGNAGVSLAAYAGAAGLRCVIVATPSIDPLWRNAIEMHGAELVATSDTPARWRYVAEKVQTKGWFPITNFIEPPVGSNCWGVDGYKTVAFELYEQSEPSGFDFVIVPSARGDLLWGLYEGFRILTEAGSIEKMPRLVAVEPYPRLSCVLEGADYRCRFPGKTALVSIAGATVTLQAVDALKSSNGFAVAVRDAKVHEDKKALASQGMYLELSAAAVLTAVRKLRASGQIQEGARVAVIGTASGFHETPQGPQRPIKMAKAGAHA